MKNFPKLLFIVLTALILIGVFFIFWHKKPERKEITSGLNLPMVMKILSSAFENNSQIPSKYTCDGENINPPLKIENIPSGTQSLVLIVEDPDALGGTFLHWLVWNINPDVSSIEENSTPLDSSQGKNDFGKEIYGGPCPPSGNHHYFFKLYALDKKLDLAPGSKKKEVEELMKGHILDEAQLVGLYQRK